MYATYFPMRKSSGYVQTWTVTSLICCSSSSLNNPPSVFLGESHVIKFLFLKLKPDGGSSNLGDLCIFFSLLGFSLSVCLVFLLLLFSLSLFPFALSLVLLSSPSLHLVVSGVRCQETREMELEPRVRSI